MKRKDINCITGMHRSGTSMVARMLNLCGLYMGPPEEFMKPRPDNPKGFGENRRFVALNEDILVQMGGDWDCPPDLSEGWESKPELGHFRQRAEELIKSFCGHEPWGWKDPRNCLTLPFWKSLLTDMKVIICIRNPYEVAESLMRRNGISRTLALKLWFTYNHRILAFTEPHERIITHYDSYFINPEAELNRILSFIGLNATSGMIERACNEVSFYLRHHLFTMEDIQKSGASPEVVDLYRDMCNEAGQFDGLKLKEEQMLGQKAFDYQGNILTDKNRTDYKFEEETAQQDQEQSHSYTIADELEKMIQKDTEIIKERDLKIKEYEGTIRGLEQNLFKQSITIIQQQKELTRLKDIENSLIWQGILKILSFIDRIVFPWHTKRGRLYWFLIEKLRTYVIQRKKNGTTDLITEKSEYSRELEEIFKYNSAENLESFEFKQVKNPLVSVIIPAYNQYLYTYYCLKSILENTGSEIPYEVIVANDSSTDETLEMLSKIKGVKVISNERNMGFLRNCNNAAKHAEGKYIVFLNNDTNIQKNWMKYLAETLEKDNSIGLVGSKLIYNNRQLQEAGGIIWRDASGWNYGRDDDPEKPEYNYVKEVDYISGASIMIRRELWERIGGFDERYEPAYFEDSDLAFEVRKLGFKVVYQPASVVVHFEGVSHGRELNSGIKSFQVKNRSKFIAKWKNVLDKEHFENGHSVFNARDRSKNKKTILVVDHYVPHYDKDAGNRTSFQYLKLFTEMGFNVKFIGDNFYRHEPYTTELQQIGIEVLYGVWYKNGWGKWVSENGDYIDYIYLQRPHITIKYIDFLRKQTKAKIIYYVHDLHYISQLKKYELTGNREYLIASDNIKKVEFKIFEKTDVITTPSVIEKEILAKNFPDKKIYVQPCFIYDCFTKHINNFADRRDIMFVGGFGHPPNIDAVVWFSKEVFPKIVEGIPDIRFFIVGSNPTDEILSLSSSNIIVTGYVSDEELLKLYNKIRIVVIPLRYGSGTKGKTVEAMYHGIPIVSTYFGLEGLGNIEEIIKSYDTVEDFADEVIRLYRCDNGSLMQISQDYIEYTKQYFSRDMALKIMEEILS